MNPLIANCNCLVTEPTGESYDYTLGVSQPLQQRTGEYGCYAFLPDSNTPRMIFGVDSLQSLLLALKFMADRINDLLSKQWKFEYVIDGITARIPFESYFMHAEWLSSLYEIGKQAKESLQNVLTKPDESK